MGTWEEHIPKLSVDEKYFLRNALQKGIIEVCRRRPLRVCIQQALERRFEKRRNHLTQYHECSKSDPVGTGRGIMKSAKDTHPLLLCQGPIRWGKRGDMLKPTLTKFSISALLGKNVANVMSILCPYSAHLSTARPKEGPEPRPVEESSQE